jgi:hypothetical protein
MNQDEILTNEGSNQARSHHFAVDALLTISGDQLSQRTSQSKAGISADTTHDSPTNAHSATGPKTAAGKRRSSRNALKSGIFSKAPLLNGESRAEYESTLSGLREDLQPHGTLEAATVDEICWVLWCKRRLRRAEHAEITYAPGFKRDDLRQAEEIEAWDQMQAEESAGGLLRLSSNTLLIQQALEEMKIFRKIFEITGFQGDREPPMLMRIYGKAAPFGILHLFRFNSTLAKAARNGKEGAQSAEELKESMVGYLDSEIERLRLLVHRAERWLLRRREYEAIAALAPSEQAMDRFIRYGAHLSREVDRLLNRLERLKRMRLGQPGPPTVRLELND